MVFREGGNAPLLMTTQKRIATKFSEYDEPLLKYKTRVELLGNLRINGVDMYVVGCKRVGKLQDVFCENLISLINIIRN